jgi:hypothetical protein
LRIALFGFFNDLRSGCVFFKNVVALFLFIIFVNSVRTALFIIDQGFEGKNEALLHIIEVFSVSEEED